MKKILYFEGAGWSGAEVSKNTVGNCRIRTAFHLDNGQVVYLEILGNESNKNQRSQFGPYVGYADDVGGIPFSGSRFFPYTKKGILTFVNDLGASFDEIMVVPDYGGYRVFPERPSDREFNFGDEFEFDAELTARRQEIHDGIYKWEKAELAEDRLTHGKRFVHTIYDYPNFSLWVDENDKYKLHLLRHYNGYNKHWEIDVREDDWKESMVDTELGKYGC